MGFPIYTDKYQLTPMLSAEQMIEFRRRQGGLAGIQPPQAVILCLYKGVLKHFRLKYRATKVNGFLGDLYVLKQSRGRVAVMGSFGIGSPVVASLADELIAWGVRRLVLLSLAGGLQADLQPGDVILGERAVRDEGASYHYLPPTRYVAAASTLVAELAQACARRGIAQRTGATWSTDAPYRESREEVDQFQSEGVLTVDMESGGLFAVGQVRRVEVASVFVVGDSLAAPRWAAPPDMHRLHQKLKLILDVLIESL